MPATQRGSGVQDRPEPLGASLLRRHRQAPPQVAVPVQVRRARPLPRRDRTAAAGRGPGLPELTLAEFVPLYLERHAASVRPRTITTLREAPRATRARVRGRAAARPGTDERRDRGLAGDAAGAKPLRLHAGAPAIPRRGACAGATSSTQPGEARGPEPAAAAASDPRLHLRGVGGHRGRTGAAATGRSRRSPPLPDCGPRSGRRLSVAT